VRHVRLHSEALLARTSVVARSRYAQVLMGETTRWYEDEYRSIVDINMPVKERVHRISHILVIVDPSAEGRQAFHHHGSNRSEPPEYSDALRVENSFKYAQLEQFVRAYGLAPEHLHVEMRTPGDCLSHLVAKSCADVVVIGASLHGRWHRMIVGSTTATIVGSLPCDILIVRPAGETGEWYEKIRH
jgi:nucleotide-binding universal stress UspA family protein